MAFLHNILSYSVLQSLISEELTLWDTIHECATIIGLQGMTEDRHLCLLTGGWKGLLRFSEEKLLSESAEMCCVGYVSALEESFRAGGVAGVSDAALLNSSLVYIFPTLTSI